MSGEGAVSELIDYHARFYSPTLGRFIQPDTVIPALTNSQAWNRYAYVMNSPIMYNDPSGHKQVLYDGDQSIDTELRVRTPSSKSNLIEYCARNPGDPWCHTGDPDNSGGIQKATGNLWKWLKRQIKDRIP
ncbi:MAG: RHS repeat-associated core domain-containing protein, partial [Anaerolineales bacterium]